MRKPPLPDVTSLLSESFRDLRQNFRGYCTVGFPALLYFLLWAHFVGFILVFMRAGAGNLGPVRSKDLDSLAWIALFIACATCVVVILLQAAIGRAVAAHLDGEKLTILSTTGRYKRDRSKVLVVQLLIAAMTVAGFAVFVVPAFIVSLFTSFAFPAVLVHRVGAVEAISMSVAHTRANFGWHCRFWALGLGVFLVVSQVPVLGVFLAGPWMFSYTLRGYRAAFGFDEVPRLV